MTPVHELGGTWWRACLTWTWWRACLTAARKGWGGWTPMPGHPSPRGWEDTYQPHTAPCLQLGQKRGEKGSDWYFDVDIVHQNLISLPPPPARVSLSAPSLDISQNQSDIPSECVYLSVWHDFMSSKDGNIVDRRQGKFRKSHKTRTTIRPDWQDRSILLVSKGLHRELVWVSWLLTELPGAFCFTCFPVLVVSELLTE